MSTLVVEVCEVKAVYPHPNADALEFITVKGWPVIVQKALGLKAGDRVVYFPPDSVMPPELADRLGITKYLAPLPRGDRRHAQARPAGARGPAAGRAQLRDDRPPGRPVVGGRAGTSRIITASPSSSRPSGPTTVNPCPAVAAFHRYTEIENIRNFPDVLRPGEEVVITEKIHGKIVPPGAGPHARRARFEFMAGSHGQRRKEVDAKGRPSDFWRPMTDAVRGLLQELSGGERSVVVFGELYGSGVQDMAYGLAGGAKGFRAFDIAVDGKYLDHDAKAEALRRRTASRWCRPSTGGRSRGRRSRSTLTARRRCARPTRRAGSAAGRGASSPR